MDSSKSASWDLGYPCDAHEVAVPDGWRNELNPFGHDAMAKLGDLCRAEKDAYPVSLPGVAAELTCGMA